MSWKLPCERNPHQAAEWCLCHDHLRPTLMAWVSSGEYASERTGDLPRFGDFQDRYCGSWDSFHEYAESLAEQIANYFDWTTIRDRLELILPSVTLAYNPFRAALIVADHDAFEAEALTVGLTVYGYVAAPREVFVKDWSEHSGLAAAIDYAEGCHSPMPVLSEIDGDF